MYCKRHWCCFNTVLLATNYGWINSIRYAPDYKSSGPRNRTKSGEKRILTTRMKQAKSADARQAVRNGEKLISLGGPIALTFLAGDLVFRTWFIVVDHLAVNEAFGAWFFDRIIWDSLIFNANSTLALDLARYIFYRDLLEGVAEKHWEPLPEHLQNGKYVL